MTRTKTVREQIEGELAHVPAEVVLSCPGDPVTVYALLRCLGADRSTQRSKDSLAAALGWNRKRLYRAAAALEEAGWLTRVVWVERGRHRAKWTVLTSPAEGTGPDSGTGESQSRSGDWSQNGDWTSPAQGTGASPAAGTRTPPPKTPPPRHQPPLPPQRGGGGPARRRRFSEPNPVEPVDLDAAWRSLTSWDREQAVGAEELRGALEGLLAAPRLRAPAQSLVLAWLERATSREGVSGVRSLPGLLVRLALDRDPEADAAELAERVAEGRRRMARDGPEPTPEREPTPAPDPDVLTALRRAATRRAL